MLVRAAQRSRQGCARFARRPLNTLLARDVTPSLAVPPQPATKQTARQYQQCQSCFKRHGATMHPQHNQGLRSFSQQFQLASRAWYARYVLERRTKSIFQASVMYQGKCLLEGAPAVFRMLFRIQPDIVCTHFRSVDAY